MDTITSVRTMIDDSGLTHRQIAHRLGKYDTYVSQVLNRGKTLKTDTLLDIARACGYRLDLVPTDGGKTITIGDAPTTTDAPTIDQARALLLRAAAVLDSLDD